MEVYAGFCEHVDTQIGRVVDEIDSLGYGENTLIFYIWGDNGASAEGQNGTISELLAQNGIPSTIKQHIRPSIRWAVSTCSVRPRPTTCITPAGPGPAAHLTRGPSSIASHFGGTRNPMAVRWPAKIKPDATPRSQFHHVNDIVPTIYEIVGITPPRVVNGIEQDPIDGVSFAYTFNDAKAQR